MSRGVAGNIFNLVIGAVFGAVVSLVLGVALEDPVNRFWHRLKDDTYQLDDQDIEIVASSTLASQDGCRYAICNYSPDNLTDSRLKSAWASDGSVSERPELQILLLQDSITIDRLEIWPGWQDGDGCRMRRNARPREIEFLDEESNRISNPAVLKDAASGTREDDVTVVPVGWSSRVLRIRINDTYPGQDCNGRTADPDVLISEIEVYARY